MKFRNYCIVVMGDTLGVKEEIQKVSEITPNILDAKGILIATFSSIVEPNELTDWFKENNRSFMVFDLNKSVSGFNITKKEIHEGLFGFLKTINVESMGNDFFNNLSVSDVKEIKETKQRNILNKDIIGNMSKIERMGKLDELIDNGLDKLSEDDKKLLPLLAK